MNNQERENLKGTTNTQKIETKEPKENENERNQKKKRERERDRKQTGGLRFTIKKLQLFNSTMIGQTFGSILQVHSPLRSPFDRILSDRSTCFAFRSLPTPLREEDSYLSQRESTQ